MKRKTYGVGVNDCELTRKYSSKTINSKQVQTLLWMCPYYIKWNAMLKRCYSSKYLSKNPKYIGCYVCEEWLLFSNFKNWCEDYCSTFGLNIKHVDVDKDILCHNNKCYSSETCCLVLNRVNKFLTYDKVNKGKYPIGVSLTSKGNIRSRCKNPFTLKEVSCGYHKTPDEAHEAWRQKKYQYACELADSDYVQDERVADALRKRFSYEIWYSLQP